MYGEANEAGVAMVAELAAEASADCDLTRAPAYVYTTDDKRVGDIEREATVAARLGLPAVLADPSRGPVRACPGRGALSRPVAPRRLSLLHGVGVVDRRGRRRGA